MHDAPLLDHEEPVPPGVAHPSHKMIGAGLIAAEIVYTITDPPIRMFRRLIPPLRIGPVALDMGLTLTMIVVLILMSIARSFI